MLAYVALYLTLSGYILMHYMVFLKLFFVVAVSVGFNERHTKTSYPFSVGHFKIISKIDKLNRVILRLTF